MREPGRSRERLARILGAAFAEGLLSEETLSYRLELLYAPGLIEPRGLIGDLPGAARSRARETRELLAARLAEVRSRMLRLFGRDDPSPLVLALDLAATGRPLTIGRSSSCDVAIGEPTVSRRHALLRFRDGHWIVQDLGSKNGLTVNGRAVGRSEVGPGDLLGLGMALVELD
ncbi:MAG TPA: FHA domain-containing protein [Solirubrobacteraceae bacterium]|nr:FHA domain-containing protein [Solirubrobacteraceae bacterium]